MAKRVKRSPLERFVSKVQWADTEKCWEWLACKRNGYGAFNDGTRVLGAHVFAYTTMAGNELEPGELVRHLCNNPGCVNPRHLAGGTQKDNMADRDEAGTTARGSRNGMAKFTEDEVVSIYLDRETAAEELAKDYGVTPEAIRHIRRGDRWGHVTSVLNDAIEAVASEEAEAWLAAA